jgi:8-oxo-dGTP pyrophosphatase MutT (NUDIX family)
MTRVIINKENNYFENLDGIVKEKVSKVLTGSDETIFCLDNNVNGLEIVTDHKASSSRVYTKQKLDIVSFVIVINEKNEILLVKETDDWKIAEESGLFFPAGHVDPGENFIQGAVREAIEEAHVFVKIESCLMIKYFYDKTYSPIHLVMSAKIVGGKLKTVPDKESQWAKFFPLKQVIAELRDEKLKKNYRKPWEVLQILDNILIESNGEFVLKQGIPIEELGNCEHCKI